MNDSEFEMIEEENASETKPEQPPHFSCNVGKGKDTGTSDRDQDQKQLSVRDQISPQIPTRQKKQLNAAKQTTNNQKQRKTKAKSVAKDDDSLSIPESVDSDNSNFSRDRDFVFRQFWCPDPPTDCGSTISTELDLKSDPPMDDTYPEETASAMGTTVPGSMMYVAGKDLDEDLKRAATVIVWGCSGVTDEILELFLENKKKCGGGELKKLERDPEDDNRAVAVFQNPEVAKQVLSSHEPLVVFGQTLTVEPPPAPPKIDPFSVVVEGIKPYTHKDSVELLFENKKRSGGGDIKHLEYDEKTGVAVIVFEEKQVASRVLGRIGLLLLEESDLTVHPRRVGQPQPSPAAVPRVVVLDNIDLETTKELLELFMENKRKSGGGEGEIEDLQYSPGSGTAIVTFTDPAVAERVLFKENLQLRGAKIIASSPKPPESVAMSTTPHMRGSISSSSVGRVSSQEFFVVEVTGVGSEVSMDHLRMVLESGKLCGGPLAKPFKYNQKKQVVWANFRHSRDAAAFYKRRHITVGETKHEVYPLDTRYSDSSQTLAIIVQNLPSDTPQQMINLYFSNRYETGGGQIDNLYWNSQGKKAVITFNKIQTVQNVLDKHTQEALNLNNSKLKIRRIRPPHPPRLIVTETEDSKLMIINAPSLDPKDLKEYFSRSTQGAALDASRIVKEICYSPSKNNILLEFCLPPDYAYLLKFCSTRPLRDHMLTLQRVALPTYLQVQDQGLNTELVELYFQASCSGGNQEVKVIERDESAGCAILDCKSHRVLNSIVSRKHVIQEKPVTLSVFYPELGVVPMNCDITQPWGYKPQPFISPLGDPHIVPYIWIYLSSFPGARGLADTLAKKTQLFEVDWERSSQAGLFVSCAAAYKPQRGGKDDWKKKCRYYLDNFLKQITVCFISTLKELFLQVVTEAQKAGKDKEILVLPELEKSTMVLVGWEPTAKPIMKQIYQMNKSLEQLVMREKLSSSVRFRTPHYIIRAEKIINMPQNK